MSRAANWRRMAWAWLCAAGLAAAAAHAADWPQWRGPDRSGCSAETGLLQSWPEGGPALLWCVEGLGKSHSSTAIAGGRIYAPGAVGTNGFLFCLDLDGQILWKTGYGPEGPGGAAYARSTPTVDGDRVYLMTAQGRVVCMGAAKGELLWELDTVQEFGAKVPQHGIAESVAVAGGVVVCTPGGSNAAVIGIDRLSGRARWRTEGLSDGSGYNQPLVVRRGGLDLAVVMTDRSLLGIDAVSGRVLWRESYGAAGPHAAVGQQCFTPALCGDILYAPAGPDAVARGYALSADGASVRRLWEQPRMTVHHGGVVAVGGCVYGTHGHWRAMCLDARTGQILYESPQRVGMAATIYADGMLYMAFLDGTVRLVRATPGAYQEVSAFRIPKGSGEYYAHPAIANGRLYLRHGEALMAYDIRRPAQR